MSNPELSRRVAEIVRKVEIRGVRLTSGRFCCTILTPGDLASKPVLHLEYRASAGERDPDGAFKILVELEGTVQGRSESEPAVTIAATFELTYALSRDITVAAEDLDAFANVNGIFNTWPYWREFFQSSLTRMSLPVFQLPVLRGFPSVLHDDAIEIGHRVTAQQSPVLRS